MVTQKGFKQGSDRFRFVSEITLWWQLEDCREKREEAEWSIGIFFFFLPIQGIDNEGLTQDSGNKKMDHVVFMT